MEKLHGKTIDEIMNNITKDENLCIVREALENEALRDDEQVREGKDKPLKRRIEKGIERLCTEIAEDYELTSGDISPDDDNELDRIKEDLYFLMVRFINNNKS